MNNKILVIKPPFDAFPIGFAYVLSCLVAHKVPFDFIDTEFGHNYRKLLKKNDYFAVATGGLIGQFNFFREVACAVRKINPELPIIIGGNITKDIRPDFLIDKIGATFGIVGEAETSLPYLIDALIKRNDNFDDLPGLIFKDQITGAIKRNLERRLDLSINILPAWHHINVDYYSKVSLVPGRRSTMPVLSGRGCVGRCSFCSPSIGSFKVRPLEHIIREVEWLNSKYSFEWIVFMNEMFYRTKEEIGIFCDAYKILNPRKKWACTMRVDVDIDVDTFLLMKDTGCVSVSAGIESGSSKTLKLMNKKTTPEQIKKFFRDAKTAGLPSSGTFLVGNEGETEADLKETIDMVINEEMTGNESLTNAYPGTLIFKNAIRRGLINDEWDYLLQLKFGCEIWDYKWVNRRHVNISEIPDGYFWEVIVKELRRYNTFLLNRFKAKDIRYTSPFGLLIKATGSCPSCGASASVVSRRSLLGLKSFCPNCFQAVIFNLYELNDFNGHFEFLRKELQKTKVLVILGAMKEAVSILRYDYFGLDYDKITGFIEPDDNKPPSPDFIYKPKLRMIDLLKVMPDTVLIVDDHIQDAEFLIRHFYLKRDLPPPQIIHLWPDSKRWNIRVVRLIQKYKVGGVINKIFFSLIIQWMILCSNAKSRFFNFLISTYPKLLRLKQLNWIRSTLAKLR